MRRLLFCMVTMLLIIPTLAQEGARTTFTGRLDDEKSFYEYPILVTENGTTIIAEARATSGDLDTIVYLLDDAENILAQNDNRQRDILDSYLEYPSANAGTYTLILARYDVDDGNTSGDFELTLAQVPTMNDLPPYDISTEALKLAGYPILEPQAQTDWTILVYYGGDTNLEESLIKDLNEFQLAGGSDEHINIIALLDRSSAFSEIDDNWTGARLYQVTISAEGDTIIQSRLITDLGERDMGDGATLAQFLAWGIGHYPANHYALAFGSHGAGWAGIITDDTDKTIINLTELDTVFTTLNSGLREIMFDLVINDACLMSSVEYHAVMSRYFKTSFASPEIVIDPALDMTLFTNGLRDNPAPDNISAIGGALIDRYINVDLRNQNLPDWRYMTSAVTDLTQFSPIETAINNFADVILTEPLRYSAMLGEARDNAYTYSGFRNGSSLIDLGNFMRQVILLSSDEPVITSAQAVLAALENAVVHRMGGDSVANRVLYQNIYFPTKAKDFENDYLLHSPLKRWGDMLRAYYNSLSPKQWKKGDLFHPPTPPQIAITNQYPDVPSLINPLRMNMEVIGRNIAQGTFTADYQLPSGEYERLIDSPIEAESLDELGNITYSNEWGSGVFSTIFHWNVTVSQLTDGTLTRYISLRADSGSSTASLEGRYRLDDSSEWHEVIVIFAPDTDDDTRGVPIRVISRNPNSDALAVVHIPDGAQFQVFQTLVTANGKEQISPDENYTFTWHAQNLQTLWTVPAPSGNYQLGFKITTYGGTDSTTSTPVTVNNADIAPNLRGYTDTVWGYTIVLDENWYEPTLYADLDYEEASHIDETKRLRVYQYQVMDEASVEVLLASYGFEIFDQQSAQINGENQTLYSYTDGDFIGIGALYPIADGDLLFVGVETFNEENADLDGLSQTVQDILSDLTQFDPRTIIENDTALWDKNLIGTLTGVGFGANYDIPKTWRENLVEDGIWIVASPQNAPNVFMRLAQVEAYDPAVLLDAIIADYVQPNLTNFTIAEKRVYYAQFNTWQVGRYNAMRGDIAVVGRVYTTIGTFGNAIVIWQEAPAEIAQTLFSEVFETIIDALFVNKPFRSYPLGEYGFTLNYPRRFGYLDAIEEDGYDYLIARNPDGMTYIVDLFADTNDYDTILDTWQDFRGFPLIAEPEPVNFNGKDGLLLTYEFEDDLGNVYAGYGFLTTSTDNAHGILLQVFWTNIEADIFQFQFLMGIHNYGIAPQLPTSEDGFTYARGWVIASNPAIGIDYIYPNTWGNITFNNTFGEDRFAVVNSPTGESELSLYVTDGDGEALLAALYDFNDVTLAPIETVLVSGGIPARLYAYTWNAEDGQVLGVVVYLQNPDGFTYIFEWANYGGRLSNVDLLIGEFLDGIVIYPPADMTDSAEEDVNTRENDETTSYVLDELGISVTLPADWYAPETDGDLYYSANPDEDTYFYIYVVSDVESVEDAIGFITDLYGLEITTDFTPITLGGYDATEFEFLFDDQTGIGVALMVDDTTALIFSVEGLIPDTQPDLYQAIIIEGVKFLGE